MRRNDPRAALPDAEFMSEYKRIGPTELGNILKISKRNVLRRRERLEHKYGRQIPSPESHRSTRLAEEHDRVLRYKVDNGVVLIGSDAHIWPGKPSTAMRAFIKFCKELRPALVVLNGDVLDFPQVSRHPPIGHAKLPNIADEIECAQEQLHQIELATVRSCKLIWTLGNHDSRFETRLATVAPEYAKLHGHSLKHYFPAWSACWRCDINDDVVVKHRWKGGVHATHNNAVGSGKTMVTGHLHSQKVTAYTDYNGTRYGVDSGCLASPDAESVSDYTEMSPLNWRSGFALLTFKGGKLLPPELVTVWDDKHVVFRGEIISV